MSVHLTWYPMASALKFRYIAENCHPEVLRVLAKNLDLPMEDPETVEFLREAFMLTFKEIQKFNLTQRLKGID